jgi:hypothetical protein
MKGTKNSTRRRALSAVVLGETAILALSGFAADAQQPPATPSAGVVDISSSSRFPWHFEKTYTKVDPGAWKGARTSDGQPDVSGSWSNTISNHANFTDPQGGMPNDAHARPNGPRSERAPSRVTDPADGSVPFQPWALEKVKDFQDHFWNPTAPQYIEPLERCAPGSIPKSLYFYGYEISQYPGYVVFTFDTGSRIIHLDGKPHLPDNLKLWNGDSRGHWQGNTLLVDVRNLNGKALFGRSGEFFSENATVAEKYTFANDGLHFTYQAVITDPTVFTRPFTVTIPARKWTNEDHPNEWAFAATVSKHPGKEIILEPKVHECVENNDGFALGSGLSQ